jgi:hypothetical protein
LLEQELNAEALVEESTSDAEALMRVEGHTPDAEALMRVAENMSGAQQVVAEQARCAGTTDSAVQALEPAETMAPIGHPVPGEIARDLGKIVRCWEDEQ